MGLAAAQLVLRVGWGSTQAQPGPNTHLLSSADMGRGQTQAGSKDYPSSQETSHSRKGTGASTHTCLPFMSSSLHLEGRPQG